MKELIKKYKKWILIFSFVYIYILMVLIAPVAYTITTPGGLTSVENSHNIEDISFDNDISTIYVSSYNRVTIFQKWLIENNKRYSLDKKNKFNENLSNKDQATQGAISKNSSHLNSIITAYTYANKVDSSITINYKLAGFTVYNTDNKDLKIGNYIVKINGKDINNLSFDDYIELVGLELNGTYLLNQTYNVSILKNNVEEEVTINDKEYLSIYPYYEIISSNPSYNKIDENKRVGGPSGGMIQAFAIYSALLNIEYNSKIAGTGTIELDNKYSVGKIGGLPQKYHTALEAKVDYFIIPSSQYELIENIIEDNHKMKVITVETFDDVIKIFAETGGI